MRGGIEDIITKWAQREDKPFVQESLTLLYVAEETKLSPRLLSEFLNKYYKVNFCTWINTLRNEYEINWDLDEYTVLYTATDSKVYSIQNIITLPNLMANTNIIVTLSE